MSHQVHRFFGPEPEPGSDPQELDPQELAAHHHAVFQTLFESLFRMFQSGQGFVRCDISPSGDVFIASSADPNEYVSDDELGG